MKKRKIHLTIELTVLLVVIVIGASMLFSFLTYLFTRDMDEGARVTGMYLGNALSVCVALIVFFVVVDRLFVRRIRKFHEVVKEVTKGNYDVTVSVKGWDELSLLGESVNQMTRELQANALLSKDFTRYVSHEFKTPISVIRSYAEAAQLSKRPEKTEEYLEVIISESDRLADLSRNVLELCKIDSTTIIPKNDRFSPAAQIRSLLLSLQFEWGKKNLTIEPNLQEFEILSNEGLVFRIWQNLIGNAVKFSNDNGRIYIWLTKENDELVFTVTDDGIGISEEDKQKIFMPFFTGDKSNSKRDSGLGLPLTKNIVEKLGGSITFESELGKGTEFTVRFPV